MYATGLNRNKLMILDAFDSSFHQISLRQFFQSVAEHEGCALEYML